MPGWLVSKSIPLEGVARVEAFVPPLDESISFHINGSLFKNFMFVKPVNLNVLFVLSEVNFPVNLRGLILLMILLENLDTMITVFLWMC